jgi:hypothetical protein
MPQYVEERAYKQGQGGVFVAGFFGRTHPGLNCFAPFFSLLHERDNIMLKILKKVVRISRPNVLTIQRITKNRAKWAKKTTLYKT